MMRIPKNSIPGLYTFFVLLFKLYGLDLLALNTNHAFEAMKTTEKDKQDLINQLREEFKQVLNQVSSSTTSSKMVRYICII